MKKQLTTPQLQNKFVPSSEPHWKPNCKKNPFEILLREMLFPSVFVLN